MITQRTIKESIKTSGIGLHSGRRVTAEFYPAPANTGIVYRRIDLNPVLEIKSDPFCVQNPLLCTTLSNSDGVTITTVEHLTAALAALGIDNIYINTDSNELPVMDGSAYPFIYILQLAGIEELGEAKSFIRVKKTVRVSDGDKWLEIAPKSDGFFMDIAIDYKHPVIENTSQRFAMDFSSQAFICHISRARTFCLRKDVESMRTQGLALGGSLENAVVVDEFDLMNPEGLRYPDEFVKHKWLDAFGDLYLHGHPLLGCVRGYKVGHALNNQLMQSLLSNTSAWEWFTFTPSASKKMLTLYTPLFASC